MHHRLFLPVLLGLLTGCAGNILDTDLLVSNTFFLPPAQTNTIFIQNRNASDNQEVTLSDLESRLTAEFRMRTAAHVLQKKPNIEETSPIIQQKLNTGIAGMF